MGKRECEFCKCYERQVEYAKQHDDAFSKTRFYAAFVTKTYMKKLQCEMGTINYGEVRLHYCPYCGKKLR